MTNLAQPPLISRLSEIATDYRYLLSDVWGIVHNGETAHHAATRALIAFREAGGKVLLITNAPRLKRYVVSLLDKLGVEPEAYDDIITSGGAARDYLLARPGVKLVTVGPERDDSIHEGLDVTITDEEHAELIVCTGLYDDEIETPDDYVEAMKRWLARDLPMLCVNPDKVVERGDRLVWCAGALAERYESLGGKTVIVGKPHPPIYRMALDRMAEIAGEADRHGRRCSPSATRWRPICEAAIRPVSTHCSSRPESMPSSSASATRPTSHGFMASSPATASAPAPSSLSSSGEPDLDRTPARRQVRRPSDRRSTPSMAARAPSLKSYDLDHVPPELVGGVVAVGNFDGVHRGHQKVLEVAQAEARRRATPALMLTFEPHPRTVFRPETPVFRLTPLAAKTRLVARPRPRRRRRRDLRHRLLQPFRRSLHRHNSARSP